MYTTNITPDPGTGIGRWPEAAFGRAMREGVDRTGRHLYPAFPYDHFTLVTDADNRALYAFLMTRQPVAARAPANALPFPLNQRFVLAGWKLLFLRPGPYTPDPAHDAEWNRGAYLAEGLAHCGACHTPRNLFGAEETGRRFAGGDAEGWHAVPIGSGSPAPVPWTRESLFHYLRDGWHGQHGTAQGPMAPVADSLAAVPEQDVQAIAAYVASVMGLPDAAARKRGDALAAATADPAGPGTRPQSAGSQTIAAAVPAEDAGAAIYAGTCAACHESGRPSPFGGLDLRLSSAISGDSPANLIRIIRHGVPAASGARGPIMPGFATALSDRQLGTLAGLSARPLQRQAGLDRAGRRRAGRQTLGRGHDRAQGQRPPAEHRRRSRHAAAVRAARRAAAQRRQIRLRPGPVRLLRRAGRRRGRCSPASSRCCWRRTRR